jgi:hypothetical protein
MKHFALLNANEVNGKFLIAEHDPINESKELFLKHLAAHEFLVLIIKDDGTFFKINKSGDWIVLGRSDEELEHYIKGWQTWAVTFKTNATPTTS